MSLNPNILWQILVLLSAASFAVAAATAATTTKCPKRFICETVDACAGRHNGASNLNSTLIFVCGKQRVCCPPTIRKTVEIRQKLRKEETKKRRMHNSELFSKDCGKLSSDRIHSGAQVKPGDQPWMALLSYLFDKTRIFHCGGTLITKRYVLTAAHCVNAGYDRDLMVRLGEFDIKKDPDCDVEQDEEAYISTESEEYSDEDEPCEVPSVKDFSVETIVLHEEFNPRNLINDVALLRLDRSVDMFSQYVTPVCLPWREYDQMEDMQKGEIFSIAGWGLNMNNTPSTVLKSGMVEHLTLDDCKTILRGSLLQVTKKQTCTSAIDANACMGDSGGPLTVVDTATGSEVQLGIVSFNKDGLCSIQVNNPVIYTKVFAYKDWILDNVRHDHLLGAFTDKFK